VNRRLTLLFVAPLIAACGGGQDIPVPEQGLSPNERLTVLRYLNCVDCVIQLDSVRALALRKPAPTVDSLYGGLLNGPGPQTVAAAESVLTLGYIRDSTWRSLHSLPLLPPRAGYVDSASTRMVNGYRSRGAYGLGWIHTPQAVNYLNAAAQLQLPPSVKRAVLYARDSLPPPP
jgi:hypothetical protein